MSLLPVQGFFSLPIDKHTSNVLLREFHMLNNLNFHLTSQIMWLSFLMLAFFPSKSQFLICLLLVLDVKSNESIRLLDDQTDETDDQISSSRLVLPMMYETEFRR